MSVSRKAKATRKAKASLAQIAPMMVAEQAPPVEVAQPSAGTLSTLVSMQLCGARVTLATVGVLR